MMGKEYDYGKETDATEIVTLKEVTDSSPMAGTRAGMVDAYHFCHSYRCNYPHHAGGQSANPYAAAGCQLQ